MMHVYSVCLALATIPALTLADNKFTEPGPDGAASQYQSNPAYDIGDRMEMAWDSNFKYMDLIMFQDYPAGDNNTSFLVKLEDNTASTSRIWTVSTDSFSTDIPKGKDLVFYLTFYQNGIDNIEAWSHYFNVSLDSPAASTALTASATASGTTGTNYPTSSATASASGPGLSTGAVAGVAVGATVGGVAILGIFGFLYFRKRQKKQGLGDTTLASQDTPETSQPAPPYSPQPHSAMQPQELAAKQKPPDPAEVSGEQARYELPSSQAYSMSVPGLHEAP
ncbi:hypothetical protein FSARC_6271 [Fusarium sarcochroum]|uniref:Mid2 domain-containing protein n=1 Tax=Fusarium sarcochroum TaxID=1208366 RepID=A0A8H4TXZ9_9HYPO|nr:hypothetical protein FSARC_6271 [Fusarium sarcochroum]